jgi:hypothetical protein
MSREVLAALTPVYELATYSPPELRSLFTDWMGLIEREISGFVKTRGTADPDEIAARFRLQRSSVVSILERLGKASPAAAPD